MNVHALLASSERMVRAALIGAGQFGRSLVAQSRVIPNLDIRVLCDRDPDAARQAYRGAGVADDDVATCTSTEQAASALERGRHVVVEDASLLMALDLDIVVEATGNPEAGAANAHGAIANGKHVAMATKEADSVVGPFLDARARAAGRVYTPVDGDQPSLLLGLVSWAQTLGLEIVAAGKSSEYDFVFDPHTGRVSWQDRHVKTPELAGFWQLPANDVPATLARRREILSELPQRTVPDLCEMGIVVNATELTPDVPAFHVPVARTVEVPDVLCPAEDGGILASRGVIDVFNCLRRPDEASFAGGVFVVVACRDETTWRVLRDKGIPVSRNLRHGLLYNPQHLLGVEAPVSILSAVLLERSSGAEKVRHRCDLAACASRDWKAGEVLAITDHHHHEVAGLEPRLVEAAPARGNNPLPYYMAVEGRLTRDVAAGTIIACDMVAPPRDSALWSLRADQDAMR